MEIHIANIGHSDLSISIHFFFNLSEINTNELNISEFSSNVHSFATEVCILSNYKLYFQDFDNCNTSYIKNI